MGVIDTNIAIEKVKKNEEIHEDIYGSNSRGIPADNGIPKVFRKSNRNRKKGHPFINRTSKKTQSNREAQTLCRPPNRFNLYQQKRRANHERQKISWILQRFQS